MHDQDHIQPEELALWRQWRGRHDSAAAVCPGALDLASLIDGQCSSEQAAMIESHVASCANCALALSDIRAMAPEQGQTLLFVPPHVIDAARRLMPASSVNRTPLRVSPLRLGAGWGVAAAAAIAICLGGYQLGMAAQPQPLVSDASLLTAMSFGLVDERDSGEDALVLLTAGNGKEQP